MNFSLSEIQLMLADSIEKFVANDYDFETRQKYVQSKLGYSQDIWKTFADLGWTAVPFDEGDGGFGGGPVDMMVVMERFGKGLIVEPFLANVVLAGGILKRSASDSQKADWLQKMIAGELQMSLAFTEPQARYDLANVATTAVAKNGGWALNGGKAFVPNGGNADIVIVPARTSGEQKDEDGITLFAVGRDSEGVRIQSYATVDGHQAADIELSDVECAADSIIGSVDEAYAAIAETIDEATLAVCAEALGVMTVLTEKTIEYAKNREQFGVPIGSFQALQHRMVDMYTACEQTRSLLMWATMAAAGDREDVTRATSTIKYQIGTAGRQVAEEAVQIHGGMGVTWELDVAHYFKRLIAIGQLFGNADLHLDRLAA